MKKIILILSLLIFQVTAPAAKAQLGTGVTIGGASLLVSWVFYLSFENSVKDKNLSASTTFSFALPAASTVSISEYTTSLSIKNVAWIKNAQSEGELVLLNPQTPLEAVPVFASLFQKAVVIEPSITPASFAEQLVSVRISH